ncbi:MAG: signal peptide peptidase SppA [Erythrobacter sp. SCN 62-14]|nr:MAG: signal peptide peptidase SppA [Erythrobacter sp. SCN 62-14]
MSFARTIWKVLVGIKDGLVLLFMLLFFVALFGLLAARPSPGKVRDGALEIDLAGVIVEEATPADPFRALLSGQAPTEEFEVRDVVRALDAAAGDDRIKAVVLDLSRFLGGGQVHMQQIGEAMDRLRKAKKPVLTYSFIYGDDHMHLAAHASEVWLDPQGGAAIAGPGGSRLYYADLLDRLGVNARVYRVGEFKSAVEPYLLNQMSDAARENISGIYEALWSEWQASVTKARPKLKLDSVTRDPVSWIKASGGDLGKAALAAGLVDKLGDRVAFGARVAEIAGESRTDKKPGAYAKSDYSAFLAAHPASEKGKAIGVVTIAGEIVDGDAGPGTAGGARIAGLLDEALESNLAGLVVRVDSPGGSAVASEEIRRAIQRHRDKDIPVAVSFANIAASGGYWVAMSGDRIFAQPETITGSIGVFAVLPTLEKAIAKVGVSADGYRTTPLSGQPDFLGGLTSEADALLQASVESTYSDFLALVSKSRKIDVAKLDAIAQGRVWDGGTARQIGLVDQFGGLDEALAWTAEKAGLKDGEWHAKFLGSGASRYDSLLRQMLSDSSARQNADAGAARDLFALAAREQMGLAGRLNADLERLLGGKGVQAYCLECPPGAAPQAASAALPSHAVLRWLAPLLGARGD